MQTTIRIHTTELSPELLDGIRSMFPNRLVDIVVRDAPTASLQAEAEEQEVNDDVSYSQSAELCSQSGIRYSQRTSGGNSEQCIGNSEGSAESSEYSVGNSGVSAVNKKHSLGNSVVDVGNKGGSFGNSEVPVGGGEDSAGNGEPSAGNSSVQSADNQSLPTEESLHALLKRVFPDAVHRTSLHGSARLLLHLAVQQRENTGTLLAERSGFTYSGAAKHMMLLRKRGLVERLGWQHYALSEKARGYLTAAAQEGEAGG